jgi:hypothetical protein
METSDIAGRGTAITVCELDAATQLAPQNNRPMSQRHILSRKPNLRLEWRGPDDQDEHNSLIIPPA